MKLVNDLINEIIVSSKRILSANVTAAKSTINDNSDSKNAACNRLKLVLMHDRSNLSPGTLQEMKDELVDVIARYVEIDRDALDLNLESEDNSIALIANIPVLRAK